MGKIKEDKMDRGDRIFRWRGKPDMMHMHGVLYSSQWSEYWNDAA